jgi:hypothetical protein
MKKNIGKFDRTLRIIAGLIIIALGIAFKSFLGLIGLIPLITATFGLCPLYMTFGISSRKE